MYFAQHYFFLQLPRMLVGIQNAAATSEKTKNLGLRKGNTGSQKGLTAMPSMQTVRKALR